MKITPEVRAAFAAQIATEGLVASTAQSARSKFMPQEKIEADTYAPSIEGAQRATTFPARSRNARPYDGIRFVGSKTGRKLDLSLSSIYNPVWVVEVDSKTITRDSKWLGEAAQPTKQYFRFGALSDMPSENVPTADGTAYEAWYEPQSVTLDTEIVVVSPRFVEGDTHPIFDEECSLRVVLAVKDYAKYEA